MNFKRFTAAALLASALAYPAQAGHYVFHYEANADPEWSDPAGPMSATLYLTTSDTLNALGGYDILSATGSVDGDAVTGLAANPDQPDQYSNGHYIFDNVLYTSGPALDAPGLVVTTAALELNFGYSDGFAPDGSVTYYGISNDGTTHISPRTGLPVVTFHTTAGTGTLAAVPEPASWAMMLTGFGLAGAAMRRRAAVSFA